MSVIHRGTRDLRLYQKVNANSLAFNNSAGKSVKAIKVSSVSVFLRARLIVRCGAHNAQTSLRWYRRLVFGIVFDPIFNQTLSSKSYDFSVSPTCSIFLGMC